MRRITVPLWVIGAVLTGWLGPAAPANAESVQTTPLRTLTSGLCVGELAITAHSGSEPGGMGVSMPSVSSSIGVAPFSGACSFELILRWRNLDTGATGEERSDEVVGWIGCDVFDCRAWNISTGRGRVAVEVASNLPHSAGHAEIFVP
ncbi:hypothetical protein [Nocardia flavorosea]|uniref:hypothetical protein n=1 Tax=Nocardia flavorosea TaxID=53429 RepID=UPI002455D836|nr:hypothetical protein [Nocardia flavorosea]